MKNVCFQLNSPVTISPLVGQSVVNVMTDGEVLVTHHKPTVREPRKVEILRTNKAQYFTSKRGMYHTVKIRLHASEATPQEFNRQMNYLFSNL